MSFPKKIFPVECPKCHKQLDHYDKSWTYNKYVTYAYICDSCGAKFRVYTLNGKIAYKLIQDRNRFSKIE